RGMLASTVGIGQSAGPVVGGALGEWLGCRGLLWIPSALALIRVPLALRTLPDGRAAQVRRFDAAGGVLLAASAGLFLFSITQGQTLGFAALSSWGSLLIAIVAGVTLIRRCQRVPHPFVPLALFHNRSYVAVFFTGPLAQFVNLSVLMLVPLLVVEVNDLSSSATGLVLMPQALAMALASPFAGRLSDRVGVRRPIQIGIDCPRFTFRSALVRYRRRAPLDLYRYRAYDAHGCGTLRV